VTAAVRFRPDGPLDLPATLGVLRHGPGDPTFRIEPTGAVWRTCRTAGGPATLRLSAAGGEVEIAGWGPGADLALDGVPDLLGARDDPGAFVAHHAPVRAGLRRLVGWRVIRTGLVFEALVPAVLEQKVTAREAHRAWRRIITRFGDPAPGPAPAGMRVVPSPAAWLRLPSWEWHRAGVDSRRAATIRAVAARAGRLEGTAGMPPAEAARMLQVVPGVGRWTAAEVGQRAYGDADAVSVGDLHLPGLVGWTLIGRPVDDDGMLELLEPYRPQRYRAVRLLEAVGRKPAFGPRAAPRDFRMI